MNYKLLLAVVALAVIWAGVEQNKLAWFLWGKLNQPGAALFLNRSDKTLAMWLGDYYFNGGAYDLARAEKSYLKALRIDPEIRWGHYQLARIHFVRGNSETAIAEINRELEIYPENLRSLYVRGLMYGYRSAPGDLERAEEDFKQFKVWAPTEWAGYNDLAWILLKREKYAEAEAVIREAFSKAANAENNPWLWNSLGVAELNQKKYSRAKASFERAEREAARLTLEEWRRAYPGNNPLEAKDAQAAFLRAIHDNLGKAQVKGDMQ